MYKRIPKTLNIIILLFIILNTFSFLFLNLAWTSSSAEEPKFKIPDLQIDIFKDFTFSSVSPCPDDSSKMCVNWIGEHIANIYKYAIGIVGIIATVVMMFGGVMWIVAGGNATRIGEAKAWIGSALTGLVLALTSYVILYQVNPSLTQFKPIQIKTAKKEVNTSSQAISNKIAAANQYSNSAYTGISNIDGLTLEERNGLQQAILLNTINVDELLRNKDLTDTQKLAVADASQKIAKTQQASVSSFSDYSNLNSIMGVLGMLADEADKLSEDYNQKIAASLDQSTEELNDIIDNYNQEGKQSVDFCTSAITVHFAGKVRTLVNVEKIINTDLNSCRDFCASRKEFIEQENEFVLENSVCEIRNISVK